MNGPLGGLGGKLGLSYVSRAVRDLVRELTLWVHHGFGLLRARRYAQSDDVKLHLGCGPKVKPGWLNVDMVPQADLRLDLRRPLPLRSASCAIAYSEHFLEHLDFPYDALHFLQECHRVLKPGSRLSIGVPDAVTPLPWILEDIKAGRINPPRQSFMPHWCTTPMEQTNFMFRQNFTFWQHEHRFAYDFATLAKWLREAGFTDIRQREFDPALDSEDRRVGTLYVDALKP